MLYLASETKKKEEEEKKILIGIILFLLKLQKYIEKYSIIRLK